MPRPAPPELFPPARPADRAGPSYRGAGGARQAAARLDDDRPAAPPRRPAAAWLADLPAVAPAILSRKATPVVPGRRPASRLGPDRPRERLPRAVPQWWRPGIAQSRACRPPGR